MKRCTRCVLPETVCGIIFDEKGICSFCHLCKPEKYKGREALESLITSGRAGKRRSYEALVPLSGGRDSSYVLYLVRNVFNLKVLAVSYDNEFRNEQALVNMENACKRLGVDFISIRSRRDIVGKVVTEGLKSSVLRKLFRICNACTYGFKSTVYRTAEEYKVPLIFWGDSQPEEVNPLARQAARYLKLPKNRPFFFLNPHYYIYKYNFLRQRLEFPVPGNSLWAQIPKLKNKDVKEIHMFDYIPWDRQKIKQTITRELGWQKPDENVSSWRTDCKLSLLVDYCFYKMYGCTKSCFGYCNMISGGHMSRDEALQQENDKIAILQQGVQVRNLLSEKFNLSPREIDQILMQ